MTSKPQYLSEFIGKRCKPTTRFLASVTELYLSAAKTNQSHHFSIWNRIKNVDYHHTLPIQTVATLVMVYRSYVLAQIEFNSVRKLKIDRMRFEENENIIKRKRKFLK